ncbi:MAG: hypothetical protein JNJ61_03305 [Anaerolineae bacterium]|nr:hypothetical protein [Anaerolineae bacterium]
MDGTTQILTTLILLLAMVISVLVTQFIRRRRDLYVLRDIPAYRVLPGRVGEAIEANRPVHISLGSAGVGAGSTILALASAELAYQMAGRAAIGAAPPILTVADPTAIPLVQDTLRRAYAARGLVSSRRGSVRWYPGGGRSLAFAAALTATLGDDHVATNLLVGSFGAELALVTEAAMRRDQSVIAASDQLEGQAVAFVMSDPPLIGEEVYAAAGYLGGSPAQTASVVAQDVLRLLLILAILLPTAIALGDALLNGRFSAAIGRLLGGG